MGCSQGESREGEIKITDAAVSSASPETKAAIEIKAAGNEQLDTVETDRTKKVVQENAADEADLAETGKNTEATNNNDSVSESVTKNTSSARTDSKEEASQSPPQQQSSNSRAGQTTSKQDTDTSTFTETKEKQPAIPKPKEKETRPVPPPAPKNAVKVSVESPSDLNGPNLSPTEIEIKDGETAFSATLRALNHVGINIDYSGSGATAYVKSIGGLGEFDAGPLSGWNIYVDGSMISKSSDAWEVTDGQLIHWKYTKNYLEN